MKNITASGTINRQILPPFVSMYEEISHSHTAVEIGVFWIDLNTFDLLYCQSVRTSNIISQGFPISWSGFDPLLLWIF